MFIFFIFGGRPLRCGSSGQRSFDAGAARRIAARLLPAAAAAGHPDRNGTSKRRGVVLDFLASAVSWGRPVRTAMPSLLEQWTQLPHFPVALLDLARSYSALTERRTYQTFDKFQLSPK